MIQGVRTKGEKIMKNEVSNLKEISECLGVDIFTPVRSSSLIRKRKGSYTDLLDGCEDLNIKVKKKEGRVFEFSEPIFVFNIIVKSSGNSSPDVKFKVDDVLGQKYEVSPKYTFNDGNTSITSINNILKSFSISPEGALNFTEEISGIEILGVPLNELNNALAMIDVDYNKILDVKSEVMSNLDIISGKLEILSEKESAFNGKVESLTESIHQKETKVKDLTSNVEKLISDKELKEEKLSQLNAKLTLQEKLISDLETKEEALENNVSQLKSQKNILNEDIGRSETQLKRLKSDIDMFSDNISDYIKESRVQSIVYSLLLAVVLVGVGIMGHGVVSELNSLIDLFSSLSVFPGNKVTAIDLLLLRAPYALIISTGMYLLAKVVMKLIVKLVNIYDTKREMIGVAIVAKEIVDSSTENSGLSPDYVYSLKESLKMDLLTQTMFKKNIEKLQGDRERKENLIGTLKLKFKEKMTGTSVELEAVDKNNFETPQLTQ